MIENKIKNEIVATGINDLMKKYGGFLERNHIECVEFGYDVRLIILPVGFLNPTDAVVFCNYIRKLDEDTTIETQLRDKYPTLASAYNDYKILLALYETSNNSND